jgi:hypothetical protein
MGVKLALTVREECTLKVFENKVLRRPFGSKGEEGTVGWRKLHIEKLQNFILENIIRVIK